LKYKLLGRRPVLCLQREKSHPADICNSSLTRWWFYTKFLSQSHRDLSTTRFRHWFSQSRPRFAELRFTL